MKKFVVFQDGSFVDVEKIVAVDVYGDVGTRIMLDQKGGYALSGSAYGEDGPYLYVEETPEEVRALIQKALEEDGVEFIS